MENLSEQNLRDAKMWIKTWIYKDGGGVHEGERQCQGQGYMHPQVYKRNKCHYLPVH